MFLRFRRRPIYIYFIDDDEDDETVETNKGKRLMMLKRNLYYGIYLSIY